MPARRSRSRSDRAELRPPGRSGRGAAHLSRPAPAAVQRLGIPSYFYEAGDWAGMLEAGKLLGLAVLNPHSGPGTAFQPELLERVRATESAGARVLGYVDVSYHDEKARPLALIMEEVARHREWYGVSGVFFDQVPSDHRAAERLAGACAHLRASGLSLIAVNPGRHPLFDLGDLADVIVTFEGSYETYVNAYEPPPPWAADHPCERFWHLVYGAADIAQMRHAVALSQARGAGWVYVTPDGVGAEQPEKPANPWGNLPPAPYWQSAIAAVKCR